MEPERSPPARLRYARQKAGFRTRQAVLQATGWTPSTYKGHENGERRFDDDAARRYARRFRVNFLWLLCHTDEGGPRPTLELIQSVKGDGGPAEMPFDEKKSEIAHLAADEIVEIEGLMGQERRRRVARLQALIYRFLEAEEAKGLRPDEDMARRIAALILDSRP